MSGGETLNPIAVGADVTAVSVPSSVESLRAWARAGVLGPAEVHGAAVLTRADTGDDEIVHLAAALALWAPAHGHACIDLADAEAMVLDDVARRRADIAPMGTSDGHPTTDSARAVRDLAWPTLDRWLDALHATAICRVVQPPVRDVGADAPAFDLTAVLDDRPLVLDGTLLYTQRQWIDERIVAADLLRRCAPAAMSADVAPHVEALLGRLLPTDDARQPDQQVIAARAALRSALTVIVGGPGTGKTHTIARVLVAMLHRAALDERPLRIALAAPTGKAAARMGEALVAAITSLADIVGTPDQDRSELVRRLTDLVPTTIHRLLGGRGQRTRFVHGPEHRLDADVVVIDEASMVALPLMARLLEAVRPDARLILVGDPDQLESIDVGSVLTDIVLAAADPAAPIAGHVVRLVRPRRQAADSPIGPLADAIRLGRARDVVDILRNGAASPGGAEVTFVDAGPNALGTSTRSTVEAAIREAVLEPLRMATTAAEEGDAEEALARFAGQRVLCAHRRGQYGVQHWNRLIESWVHDGAPAQHDYVGRPLLATRNDQRQRIANGDTGIIVATPAGRRAAFVSGGGIRLLAPAQLDTVETAYAMTIHKSQGSEYATVVVILPPADSPLVGRELLYTAVTRSTKRLIVVGSVAAVVACVDAPARRVTGLAAALGTQRPTSVTAP